MGRLTLLHADAIVNQMDVFIQFIFPSMHPSIIRTCHFLVQGHKLFLFIFLFNCFGVFCLNPSNQRH